MPNKRSKRHGTKKFYCPICEGRLWRLGGAKYHLFYQNFEEIKENTDISIQRAKLIINQNKTYLDTNRWIEEFHCPKDGNFWLTVSVNQGDYDYRPSKETDWLQTNKTLDPRSSNPSVSEFTRRMSRKPQ